MLQLQIGEHRIKLTNLDRVYWPEDRALKQPQLTKRRSAALFRAGFPVHTDPLGRPALTMIRFPEGIHGERFFQKHWEQSKPPPFVEKVQVFSESKVQRTSTCYAITCLRCYGWRRRAPWSSTSGIRGHVRGPMRSRSRPTSPVHWRQWTAPC